MPQSDFDPILKFFDAKLSRSSRRRKQCITYHPILKIPLQDKSTAPLIHMETVGPGKVDIKVGPEKWILYLVLEKLILNLVLNKWISNLVLKKWS